MEIREDVLVEVLGIAGVRAPVGRGVVGEDVPLVLHCEEDVVVVLSQPLVQGGVPVGVDVPHGRGEGHLLCRDG